MPPTDATLVDPTLDAAPPPAARRAGPALAGGIMPGLFLAFLIAGLAFALRRLPGAAALSPMILAIMLGIAFHNIAGTPARARPGIKFALRRILRFAIILLGLQLTVSRVATVGWSGIAVIATTLVATFLVTGWLGRMLGVERKLAELIGAGTSICGASAVIATNAVTRADDEDVAYAVACVTVFGSLSMFLYPMLAALLHLGPHAYGLWAGSSIHEIAQVVAAAFQNGKEAGEFGTIAKLSRVMMLAPVILALGYAASRRHASGSAAGTASAPIPWFVFGFIAMIGVNSLGLVPAAPRAWIAQATTFLLSAALAAMGLETDIRKLRAKGLKPLLLGAASWLFIAGFSFALVRLAV